MFFGKLRTPPTLGAALLLAWGPLASAAPPSPEATYQTDQATINRALNDFWSLQGLGRPTGGVTANWAALLGSSDWYEWNGLKVDWADDPADKQAQRALLLGANIDGISARGAQAAGYVWPSNGSEFWLCPHPHFDQMPRFVCAVYDDYRWSRDRAFLRRMRPRVEAVMDYMAGVMDGRYGLPLCPTPYTGLPRTGPNTTYMDCYREGHTVTWIAEGYYTALQDMAALETALGDRDRAAQYATQARRLPAQFDRLLWNPRTRRYVGWRDGDGALHDYGFTYLNLEALARGLGTASEAADIVAWLDHGTARPTVMGGHAGNTDIYQCVVAPRSNTVPIPVADWDPWSVPDGLRRSSMGYGALVEDGGAMLWVNYYDVLARLCWLDADSAWRRLSALLFRVEGDPLRFTESVRHPTNIYGENYLEVGPADGPEGGLSGVTPLTGFLGVQPRPDGLYAAPNLPTSLLSLECRGVCYGSATCDVRASRGQVVVDVARPMQPLPVVGPTAQSFRAPSSFNLIGLSLSPSSGSASTNAQVRLRLERQTGGIWTPAAWASVSLDGPHLYRYVRVPRQSAGAYRVVVTPEGVHVVWDGEGDRRTCRAADVPTLRTSGGDIRDARAGLTASRTFSAVLIRTRDAPPGHVTLLRRFGTHWLPVAASWADTAEGGVLSFADQPPGVYRLRSSQTVSGAYELLASRYTVTVTDGVASTTRMVTAGGRIRLNIIAGVPVGHRIVIYSPAGHGYVGGSVLAASPATPPEVFDVYRTGGGTVGLRREPGGEFVAVGASGTRDLTTGTTGEAGRFRWVQQTSGCFALYSPAAGHYLSADLGRRGRMSAGFARTAKSWEQLTWQDKGPAPITPNNHSDVQRRP